MSIPEAIAVAVTFQAPASVAELREAEARLRSFAVDQWRMLEALGSVSFPIPGTLRLSTDPGDDTEAIYVTEETARHLRAALEKALEAR